MCEIVLWGGVGERKSNKGTQWYLRDRVYDVNGISPSLSATPFWIIIKDED